MGRVDELAATNSYTSRFLVKVEKINGEDVYGYKFYAYTNKSDAKNIVCGTRISFNADLTGFSEDSKSYNISKGINAYASDLSDLTIIEYTDGGLAGRLSYYKEMLTRYTIFISDKDSGAILSALLFGERDYLPDQLRLDFKRIGISHILALSGMHLAILSLGIEKFLLFLKVNKKSRLVITSFFVFMYMAITGFSVSVVRAGIMVILSSALFLLSRSKDSLTSLSVAVFVICLIHPYAIYDISLQLSALATFGIISFVEFSVIEKPMKNKGRVPKYLYNGIMASVFAISATLLISTSNFGCFSIVAPIATLLFSLIVELIMNLGCIMLFIGWLIPVGKILAPLCSIINHLSSWLSSFKWVYVSSGYRIVSILIIAFTIFFFAVIIMKVRKIGTTINALVIIFISILLIPTALSIRQNRNDIVAYNSEYKCDEFIIRSQGEVCLINSSQYSKSLAYDSLDFLDELKITYVDKYYLTHYSWSIDEDLDILLSSIPVEEIYLPSPRNEDEQTILKIINKKVENYRTKVILFDVSQLVRVGKFDIRLLYSEPYGETSVNAFCATDGVITYTYISSGILVDENYASFKKIISETDCLIFGEHGKKYKDEIVIDEYFDRIKWVIIHSENLSISPEYEKCGCEIYSHPQEIIYLFK